jgi:hypothetical protein
MAKRRKKHTVRRVSRRRRVSGIKDIDFTVVALTIGGAVAGRILANKLATSTNATMVKLAPYSAVALGIILPMVTKNAMLKSLSIGLIAGGGVTLLGPTGLKVISGMANTISRVGYPYNALPYKKVAGIETSNGDWVSKPNFSGSGMKQASVISGIPIEGMTGNPAGSGAYMSH